MAPNEREQRRLERQRGAGTRELKNANFGFTFGAAPLPAIRSSRRTPARTTGSLPPQRSSRRTPGPLLPQPSSRKTPKTASKQNPRQNIPVVSQPQSKPATVRKPRSSSTPAPGRPKSSSPRLGTVQKTSKAGGQPNYVTPKVIGKRKRKGGSTRDVEDVEEDELERDEGEFRASARRTATRGIPRLNTSQLWADAMRAGADGDEDELDQNGETHHLSGGARRTGSHNFLPITAPVELIDSSNSVGETIGVARRNNEKRKSAQLQQTESSEDELESPPDQALSTSGRRKKRPGSVDPLSSVEKTPVQYTQDSAASLQRSARAQRHAGREEDERAAASEDELSPVTRPPGGIPTIPEQPSRVEQREQTGDAESADELTSVVKRARNKPRRPPTQPEAAQTKATESEAEADELTPVTKRSQPESSRPKTQKASQRPPNVSRKPRAPKPADTPAVASPVPSRKAPPAAETAKRGHPIDAGVRPRKRSKPSTIASVPITVYRPSLPARPRASSPTSSDDADPLSHHSSSAPTRTTVNGIDVLAQISTEIIERMTGTLSLRLRSEASARARADGKRKRVALLAFGAELGAALFTLTGTVDAHAELGRRVRRAGKERVRLRAELLGVRREREEVACRADEVRAAHEREVGEARDWQGLSKNLFDVELAVQRGRDKAEREGRVGEGAVMGVGNLVGGVVGDVVGGGGGRGEGLLGRIRKFNALLERAAEGLEGR